MVYYNSDLDQYETYYHHHETEKERLHKLRSSKPFNIAKEHALPAFGHAIAGAFGAGVSNFATYPLDVVGTRLKAQKLVLTQRRRMKFEQRTLVAREKEKRRGRSSSPSSTSASDRDKGRRKAKGRASGIVGEKARLRRRKQSEERSEEYYASWDLGAEEEEACDGLFDMAAKIYAKEGFGGFYHGVGWDTFNAVTSGFWYFAIYNLLRNQRLHILGRKSDGKSLPVVEELGIGIATAAIARLISSPLSNVVTRKQTSAMLYPHAKPPTFLDIYHDIMREKGVVGFWSGYKASLLLTINPSITFLLYEKSKPFFQEQKGEKFDTLDTFLLAALCKAIATVVTYPLTVARTRAQMEGGMEMEEMFEGALEHATLDRGMADRGFSDRNVIERGGFHTSPGSSSSASHPRKRGYDERYRHQVYRTRGIVDTLVNIVKREGLSALYAGLGAELLRGFLAQGMTVMVKETVHKFIIQLWYFVLDAYRRSEYGSLRESAQVMESDVHSPSGPRSRKIVDKGRAIFGRSERSEGEGRPPVAHISTPIVPRSNAHPKTVERVEKWMEHVETTAVPDEEALKDIPPGMTERWMMRPGAREPSVRSGRTSLLVHPPSVVRENPRWDARWEREKERF